MILTGPRLNRLAPKEVRSARGERYLTVNPKAPRTMSSIVAAGLARCHLSEAAFAYQSANVIHRARRGEL